MMRFVTLLISAVIAMQLKASANNTGSVMQSSKDVVNVNITSGRIYVVSGIIYSQITTPQANRLLKMTLLVPNTGELKPAIVYYPGGGFSSAAHEKYIEMRMALAKAGFVVAAVEYRVIPDKFPALIVDAKSAVRYLKAHAAQFGIDASRIGVFGDSAGGYVAQMMGTTNGEKQFDQGDFLEFSSDIQAAATIYGISNLLNIGEGMSPRAQEVHSSPAVTEALLLYGPSFADFAGGSIYDNPDKALEASPMGHIKENLPPFLIMHGTDDKLVSPVQSEQLYEALTQNGNDAKYIVVENAGHGDLYWYQEPLINKVVDWFTEHLKNK